LYVDRFHTLERDEISHHRNGDQNRLIADFTLPRAAGFLAKRTDHRELQLIDLDDLAYRRALAAEDADGQFVGQQRDVLAQTYIAIVELSAINDYYVADIRVVRIYAINTDIADLSIDDELTVIRHHGSGRVDLSAEGIANGLHVGEVNEIGLYLSAVLAARFIVGKNEIRANAADLVEN
jgi:hypothetical protein